MSTSNHLHFSSQHNTATDELEDPEIRATFVPTREQHLKSYYFLSMQSATLILQVRLQVALLSTLKPFLEPPDKQSEVAI
jgi:hypothetical protein